MGAREADGRRAGPAPDVLAAFSCVEAQRLEAANACYETWADGTSSNRDAAGKARAELERRRLAQQTTEQRHSEVEREPQAMLEWWRQLESDLAEVDRAIEREHQAAVAAGKPWPPERTPQPESEPVRESENSPGPDPEAFGQSGPNDHTARLDELLAQATEAAAVSPRKRLTGKAEPTTPLVSNEKPMPNPSAPCRLMPHMRQKSSCSHAVRAITAPASRTAIL